jgi:hypothetical protein
VSDVPSRTGNGGSGLTASFSSAGSADTAATEGFVPTKYQYPYGELKSVGTPNFFLLNNEYDDWIKHYVVGIGCNGNCGELDPERINYPRNKLRGIINAE